MYLLEYTLTELLRAILMISFTTSGALTIATFDVYSEVCESLDERVELFAINLTTSVFVKLEIALVEVLLVPRIDLSRLRHDRHDELSQVLLGDVWLAILIDLLQIGVVLLEDLVAELAHLSFDFALCRHNYLLFL